MKVLIKKSTLTDIADAIREQDGDNAPIKPVDFPERIANILTGPAPEEIVIHNLNEITTMTPETTVALQVQILPNCAKQVYNVVSSNPEVVSVEQDPDTKIWSVTSLAEGEATLTITAGSITQTVQTEVVTYDPDNPTLQGLKNAINAGDYEAFPVGTEFPDTYDGNSNPLIVAQYLDNTNNNSYGGAEGAILIRKFVEPTRQSFGNTSDYGNSAAQTFLDTTYYNACSNDLKSVISDISTTYVYMGATLTTTSKWFIMSQQELGGSLGVDEGIFLQYWKNIMGTTTPSVAANAGRVAKNLAGQSSTYWTRTSQKNSSSQSIYITALGGVDQTASGNQYIGLLPACLIAKG